MVSILQHNVVCFISTNIYEYYISIYIYIYINGMQCVRERESTHAR